MADRTKPVGSVQEGLQGVLKRTLSDLPGLKTRPANLLSSALLAEPPDLLLHVLDLRLDAADLVHDLLRALAVTGLLGLCQRGLQLSQLLLKPLQLMPKLPELSAGSIVRCRASLPTAGGLSAASRLSRSSA